MIFKKLYNIGTCDMIGKELQYLIDAKTLFKTKKFLRGSLKDGKRVW